MFYRQWQALNPKAVLLLVHGLGAHSARWEFLGLYLRSKGFSSYALDLRGFGQTPDWPRGHVDSFDLYYQDILALLETIKAENPGKKVFLLAESMGGLLAFILACRQPDQFAGQILISPAFANGMKFPLSAYLTLIAFLPFNQRKLITMPFTSAMCTSDEAYQKVMNNNPDEIRVASIKLLLNILLAQLAAKRLAAKLTIPTLFLIAGQDYLVDENAGRQLFKNLKLSDKTIIEYPEMLHALSIEADREKVFDDIHKWLIKRL